MSWDDLESEAKANSLSKGPRCGVYTMLELVGEENGPKAVASILNALGNHRLTTTSIHRALESRIEPAYLPSIYSLNRHRRQQCSCPKGDK